MLRAYYRLTKPGIVYGNVFTVIAGYLYASRLTFPSSFSFIILGMAFVIAGACVYNNYFDRKIDRNMARTKQRALATGALSNAAAIIFATTLEMIGLVLLYFLVNPLTAYVALFGTFAYVIVYTFAKRHTQWGTIIGSVSGAVPIVAGYTGFANALDVPSLILFLSMVFWQMPHFYAIATYRLEEYKAAGIPVLPARKSFKTVFWHIIVFIVLYAIATVSLTLFGYAGYVYAFVMLVASAWWLSVVARGFSAEKNAWGRAVFKLSLYVLLMFAAMLTVAQLLP